MNRREFIECTGAMVFGSRGGLQRSVTTRRAMPDVVVVLPGIMGSVLQKDGSDLWAPTGAAVLRALWDIDETASSLALSEDSADTESLGDGIVPTRFREADP